MSSLHFHKYGFQVLNSVDESGELIGNKMFQMLVGEGALLAE